MRNRILDLRMRFLFYLDFAVRQLVAATLLAAVISQVSLRDYLEELVTLALFCLVQNAESYSAFKRTG